MAGKTNRFSQKAGEMSQLLNAQQADSAAEEAPAARKTTKKTSEPAEESKAKQKAKRETAAREATQTPKLDFSDAKKLTEKARFTIYIDKEDLERYRALAKENNVALNYVINKALKAAIDGQW